jgi:hypothetical protein
VTPEQLAQVDWQIVCLLARWHTRRRRYWTDERIYELGRQIRRRDVGQAVREATG